MISIEMSPCQFDKLSEVIANEHPEAKLEAGQDVTKNGTTTKVGHIHTSQIDADYEYRPRANNEGTLVFVDEQKHGMYKMVSDDTIGSHLNKLLGGIVCDQPKAEPVESKPIDDNGFGVTSSPGTASFVKPTIQV